MNRLRELRIGKKYSQEKLGKIIGCTSATISKYELEQRELDSATIRCLCDIFNCTADYLLCRSDSPSAKITEDEAALLRAYRAADDHTKAVVRLALEPFSAAGHHIQVS